MSSTFRPAVLLVDSAGVRDGNARCRAARVHVPAPLDPTDRLREESENRIAPAGPLAASATRRK
jgi:hypothetical protein